MSKKLYCQINGVRKEIFLGLEMPFPEQFHSELTPPYPTEDPVLIKGRVVMKSRLYIPIIDTGAKFSWDVWVSVSEDVVMKSFNVKTRQPRAGVNNMEALLENSLMFHPKSSGLKIQLSMGESMDLKMPPLEVITESELKDDQQNGVSMTKVCRWWSDLYSGKIKFK